MTDTLKYDLTIQHLENGYTQLKTPLHWSLYDENGEIINAGVNGHSEFPIPLPVRIKIEGSQRQTVGKAGIKSILRAGERDQDNAEFVEIETQTENGGFNDQHEILFWKLKDVMRNFAPNDGRYSLSLKYWPNEEGEAGETPDKESELVEPNDVQIASLIALLNIMSRND